MVRGFFAELVQQIGVPELQERLLERIEAELEAALTAAPGSSPTTPTPGEPVTAELMPADAGAGGSQS